MSMNAYMVAAIFADGALCAEGMVADTPEVASASAIVRFLRATKTEADLCGCIVVPLTSEFLQGALQALETGKPSGDILSLVRPPPVVA